jgi:hypothetical protein
MAIFRVKDPNTEPSNEMREMPSTNIQSSVGGTTLDVPEVHDGANGEIGSGIPNGKSKPYLAIPKAQGGATSIQGSTSQQEAASVHPEAIVFGKILAELREAGITDDTVVTFIDWDCVAYKLKSKPLAYGIALENGKARKY